jgi:hypothetical protein
MRSSSDWARSLQFLVRSRTALHLEIAALRHQLVVTSRSRRPRLRLTTFDRVRWPGTAADASRGGRFVSPSAERNCEIAGRREPAKDLRFSRHAVNHSVSKLRGKSSDSATGAGSLGPRSSAQWRNIGGGGNSTRKRANSPNEFEDLGGGGGSRTLKMSIWQLIDAAVFTGQLIERIPLPLPNRFLWCSPKRPEITQVVEYWRHADGIDSIV